MGVWNFTAAWYQSPDATATAEIDAALHLDDGMNDDQEDATDVLAGATLKSGCNAALARAAARAAVAAAA